MSHSPPLRFTVRTLLALTTAAAVAVAALVNASPPVAGVVSLAAYVALLVAVLAAAFAGGGTRAIGLGFAVGGIGYLVLIRYWDADAYAPLGTTHALYILLPYLATEIPHADSGLVSVYLYGEAVRSHSMMSVGQILWSLSFALYGAILGWWNWRRGDRPPALGRRWFWLAVAGWIAAFVGLAIAAATATAVTAGIIACLLAVVLLWAVVTACLGRGSRRAFAAGFAIGGLTYAALLGIVLDDETMERRLATTQLLLAVHPHFASDSTVYYASPGGPAMRLPSWDHFVAAGQGLWTLLFALLGGLAGWCFHRANERPSAARENQRSLAHWATRVAIAVYLLAICAAAAFALYFASRPIVGAALVLLALAGALATIAAVCLSGRRRAFAVGALIGGLSYYVLATRLPPDGGHPPLATTALLAELHASAVREVPNPHAATPTPGGFGGGGFGTGGGSSGFPTSPTVPFPYVRDFVAVGECLWTLLLALFRGYVARRFAVRRSSECDVRRTEKPI